MRRLLLLFGFSVSLVLPRPLHAKAVPISKAEARSLSERKVKAIVLAQLSDLIREPTHSTNPSPKRVLSHMAYITRPRATAVPGLCALDMLTVRFRPQEPEPWDQDTPVMANELDAHHYFLVRKPVHESYNEAANFDRMPNNTACESSDFYKDAWFNAADEESASDGALLARLAIASAGTQYPLDCAKAGTDLKGNCAPALAALDPATISSIDRCEIAPKEGDVGHCYKIYFGEAMLRIKASARADDASVGQPLTILHVDFEQLIIIADSVQD